MKKRRIAAVLFALALLLPSCGKQPESERLFFRNTKDGCALGDRFYSCLFMNQVTVYTPDGMRKGLCADPLCLHDGTDGTCPDDTRAMVRFVVTDGEKLYLSILVDPETAGKKPEDGAVKQIWSLNRDGSDFRLLNSRPSDSRYFSVLEAAGGYLWFPERRIDEDAPEGENEYTVLMRMSVEGGEPEEALDERFIRGLSYAVDPDASHVAVISYSKAADLDNLYTSAGQQVEITELKTGEKTVIPPPAEDVFLFRVHWAFGELWLEAERGGERTYERESGEEVTETAAAMVLYRLNRETERFEEITSTASGSYCFGPDAVWYVNTESEYLGTKPMPTGAPGGKQDYDFFVSKNLAVGCIRDGKITERAPGEGIEPGQVLTLLAAADGMLYGTVYDEGKLWETGEYFNHVVALDPETLGVIRDYGDLN